jgi:ankyrin repeat protein
MVSFARFLAAVALGACLSAAAQEPARTPRQVQRDDLQTAIVKDDRRKAAELIRTLELDFDFDEGRTRGRTFESPLTLAVHRGRIEIVRMLLEHGADVHRKDGSGRTAIQGAQTPAMTQVLLAAGARVDAPAIAGFTEQLWRAVDQGDAAMARALIERGADPNADNGRERILLRALFRKQWEVAEALLEGGASVKIPDRAGCERLSYCESIQAALFASFDPNLLAKLKARGLELDTVDTQGYTALTRLVVEQPMAIRAIAAGGAVLDIPAPDNAARLEVLLDAGADPNRKFRQLTPLMLVMGTHARPPAMADALIAAGGRIEHDATVPPLKDSGDIANVLPAGGLAPALVNADRPLDFGNYQGILTGMRVGPLGWAVMAGRTDIALRLLERERRIDAADRNLVYFAAYGGEWDFVLTALRHEAPADVANRAGVTPLMLAADAGRADVVRALIAAGADVRARSARSWPPLLERNFRDEIGGAIAGHSPPKPRLVGGYTASEIAKDRGHPEVLRALRQ